MPEVVSCPKCQRKSRVPDALLGKKVKCPGCGEPFTAALAPPPAPPKKKKEEEHEDDGRETYEVARGKKKRRRSDDDEEEAVADRPRRSRTRGRDDDDDDDDDRPRRRRGTGYSRDDDDDDDEDDDDDRPSRRRRRVSADWGRIHRGLTFVLLSIVVKFLLGIVLAIGLFAVIGTTFAAMGQGMAAPPGKVPPGMPPPAPAPGAPAVATATTGVILLGVLALVGTLAALGLRIAGHVFCLPSPDAYGSRQLAVATLILVLVNLGCSVLQWLVLVISLGSAAMAAIANPAGFAGPGAASSQLANVLGWISSLAGLGAFFVFLFYLRSLALAARYDGLAKSIVAYMITAVVSPVVLFVMCCVGIALTAATAAGAGAPQQQGGPGNPGAAIAAMGAMGFVCVGVMALAVLALFIWYVVILVQTRNAVASQMR